MSAAPQSLPIAAADRRLRREIGATLALAWPLVLANLAVNAMPAINAAMLGQFDARALAAGALAFYLLQPPLVLGIGMVSALAPIAAARIGAGADAATLRRATHQALISALLIAGAAWIALWPTRSILIAIGEPPDLAAVAEVYMRGYQWSLAPALLFIAGRSVFAALERPRATLVAGVAGALFDLLANYALVFGKLGAPALGVFGSGLALTLADALMFAVLVAAALIDPRLKKLRLFVPPWRPVGREFLALWRLGLPIGGAILAEVGVFSAASLAIGRFGPTAMAGHTIALQIASLAFMVPLGIGQAATVRIGRAYGARDEAAIRRAGFAALAVTVAFALASATAMLVAPMALIAPFLDVGQSANAAAAAMATALLGVAAIFQMVDATQATLMGMLRGVHDSRVPLLIALVGYWALGAPIGLALGFLTLLGAVGVWIGLAIGLAVVAALLIARWFGMARRGYLAA